MAVHYGCRSELETYLCCGVETPHSKSLLLLDNSFVVKPTRVGRGSDGGHILICGRRKSYFPFHCMVGPDWPIVVIVFSIILSVNAIVLPIISALGWPVLLIGLIGFICLMASYAAVACSDPGIVYDRESERLLTESNQVHATVDIESRALVGSSAHGNSSLPTDGIDNDNLVESRLNSVSPLALESSNLTGDSFPVAGPTTPSNETRVSPISTPSASNSDTIECGQCEIHRPRNARHCVYCGVCVERLDHHCPWCGKCIGKNNIVFFHAFLTALCFQMYFLGGSLVYYFVTLATKWPKGPKV